MKEIETFIKGVAVEHRIKTAREKLGYQQDAMVEPARQFLEGLIKAYTTIDEATLG